MQETNWLWAKVVATRKYIWGVPSTLDVGDTEGAWSIWKDIRKANTEVESFGDEFRNLFKREVLRG